MSIPSCILTLLVVYPVFIGAGVWFYRHMQKTVPQPFPEGNPRNGTVWILRFALYIVLLPLGLTLSLAILGWLDPLFFLIRDL